MNKTRRMEIEMGAGIHTAEWWLLPNILILATRRASGRMSWHVGIGWLCVSVWVGSPL